METKKFSTKRPINIKNIAQILFSVRNELNYKIISILGLKIKIHDSRLDSRVLSLNEIISHSISVSSLHREVFSKYKNINYGKNVVLIATGPSLDKFEPLQDAVYVGVNRAFTYKKVKFDYLFVQDYSDATRKYFGDFMAYEGAKKFCGIMSEEIWPKSVIPESKCINAERYYVDAPFYRKHFTRDIANEPLGDSYSIVFPAMQFILWTNPKRIYIVGCDCNTSGHFNLQKNNLNTEKVIDGWIKMKEFARIHYPDTEIISVNPKGLKGLFKDITTV